MLDSILSYLHDPENDDEHFARLESLSILGDDVSLILRGTSDFSQESWRTWRVRAIRVRDFLVAEPHGGLDVDLQHVVARQHTDSRVDLAFRGKPECPAQVVGKLYSAHRKQVGDWIPFHRYLNTLCELEWLLSSGFGKLADGPAFLIREYARVLEAEGVAASFLPPRPAKWFDGSRWVENAAQLTTLIVGNTFFVAEKFELEEQPAG